MYLYTCTCMSLVVVEIYLSEDKGACSGYTNGDQLADLISVVPN